MINKNKFSIPPLLEDFNEFSYMLTQLNHPDFGGKEVWAAEINELDTLRQDALKFMQWKANPDFQGTRVRVAVIGDFSAGKSSFINSLLGEAFCPVEVEPSTSSITTFKYGDKKQIFLLHPKSSEGNTQPQREEIKWEKYKQLVGPQEESGLRYEFEVFYPFSGFQDIELYDTPGFGNPQNEDDERITLAKCAEADAILFVFDINRGNLGEDMRFRLQEIRNKIPELRICAILNKSDQKSRSVVDELCEVWKEEGIFEEVIAYSSKREMLQFIEKKTDLTGFSATLSKTTVPYIARQLNGDIFYKPKVAECSSSQLAVMAQLTAIQNSKQNIFKKKRSKEFWNYLKKRQLLLNSIAEKIQIFFVDGNNSKTPKQFTERLLSTLDIKKTNEQIILMLNEAIQASLHYRSLTQKEKSYWNTPYWSASFIEELFLPKIKSSVHKKDIALRVKNFIQQIPPENFKYVRDECLNLKNHIKSTDTAFSSLSKKIKIKFPGTKNDFNSYEEIEQLRSSLQIFTIENEENKFATKFEELSISIIANLERRHMYDCGSYDTKIRNISELNARVENFIEELKTRQHQKTKATYA